MTGHDKLLMRKSVNRLAPDTLAKKLLQGSKGDRGQAVYLLNTHMAAEAVSNPFLQTALEDAEILVADGKPISILAGYLNKETIPQISGFDLIMYLLQHRDGTAKRIMAIGGTDMEQRTAIEALRAERITVLPEFFSVGMISDPTQVPENLLVDIKQFKPDIVFVFLGCPKQEILIYQLKKLYPATFIGLGGALQIVGGIKKRAPRLIRRLSLEWLYRLAQDPRRLWKRYITTIPIFLVCAIQRKFG